MKKGLLWLSYDKQFHNLVFWLHIKLNIKLRLVWLMQVYMSLYIKGKRNKALCGCCISWKSPSPTRNPSKTTLTNCGDITLALELLLFSHYVMFDSLWSHRDCGPSGSSVRGISQASILEWVTISFSRRSSWPRNRTHISYIDRRVLCHWATRETLDLEYKTQLNTDTYILWNLPTVLAKF